MLTLTNILSGLNEHEMDRVLILDERAGGGDGGTCGSSGSKKSKSKSHKSSKSHKKSSKGSSKC